MLRLLRSACIVACIQAVYGDSLPPPTGIYNVGLTQTVIEHDTPNDPLAPAGKAKSFLVNIWYPTLERDAMPQPAYDAPLAKLYEDYFNEAYNVSIGGLLKNVTTIVHREKVALLPSKYGTIKLPTLLFQPPFVGPPSQGFTCLLSDLASQGYTVIALDHPYEQPFIQYPNNGPGFYGPEISYEGNGTIYEQYNAIRIADTRAFLETWPTLVTKYHAQRAFNTTHFIAFGHSIGGSASIGELLELQSKTVHILGGINLDGSLLGKAGNDMSSAINTQRPTLFMASTRPVDQGWINFGTQQTSWWRYFEVEGTSHTDYSDIVLWKQWFGITKPGPNKIEAFRMIDLARTWVSAFMKKVTTGSKSTVVEGYSQKWPEVKLIGRDN